MALIGQMMYFQSRSLRASRYKSCYEQNKCIIPWKVFERFLFFSYDASKNSLFCCNFTCLVFFNALQLVNKNRSCALSLDKYLCIATCTNLNWVTWKVRIGERKKLITLCRVFLTYPTSDRISPYNINTITGRQIIRI